MPSGGHIIPPGRHMCVRCDSVMPQPDGPPCSGPPMTARWLLGAIKQQLDRGDVLMALLIIEARDKHLDTYSCTRTLPFD